MQLRAAGAGERTGKHAHASDFTMDIFIGEPT